MSILKILCNALSDVCVLEVCVFVLWATTVLFLLCIQEIVNCMSLWANE